MQRQQAEKAYTFNTNSIALFDQEALQPQCGLDHLLTKKNIENFQKQKNFNERKQRQQKLPK